MDTTQMLYLAGAFVLGFLVAWFAGRNGPKRALEECEANAHSLQRSLDDRTRSVSKLEGQLKEQVAQVDRLGSEQGKLAAALKTAEQGAADTGAQVLQLQEELSQSQSERLRLESELGHVRDAYAGSRSRLAELFAQNEAQAAAAEAEAEITTLALAEASRGEQVEQLTAQVQSLQTELEAVRANATRLAGQVALRPELTSTQQKEYAALAGDPERVVAALHQRDMQVADARAEADYLRRTVGMLTGMGAELAQEVDRRRREQQVLLYQVAGLTAVTRETEMRQLVDRQAPPVQAGTTSSAQAEQAPAGTIEPEGHDLPVDTRPDNALEPESETGESAEELAALAVDLRQQLDERSQELEELRTQTGPLQANLDELQAEIEALNAAKADLEAQLETRDNDLTELQNKLAALQSDAESAAAAKAALAEKLQARGAVWTELVSRVTAVNADLDALLAAEPAEGDEPAAEDGAAQPTEPSAEVAALAAAAPSEAAVPEAARAADAAAPAAESNEAAEASDAVEAAPATDETPDATEPLRKLAAGVAAAAALFGRKNAQLAEFEQQVQALAADKSTLEETLATKADVETQLTATSDELAGVQAKLAELQIQASEVSAAKAAVEQSLQGRETSWQNLLGRISAVSADLDALLAAEPAPEPEPAAPEAAAPEAAAPEAAAPATDAEAAAPVAEEPSAEGESSEAQVATPQDDSIPMLDKLAAGVAAAAALFGRKNATLAEREQQLNALAGDKGALESTLAAKDQSLVATQSKIEQLQAALSQRSQRFDALSMHASSLEADMEIRQIERSRLEEQVRAVAADLQALAKSYAAVPAEAAPVDESAAEPAADAAPAETPAVTPGTLDELSAAAAAVAELLRNKENTLQAAHAELTDVQQLLAEHGEAREALSAELESRGASLADFESRLQSLQGEYTGVQATQGDLQNTLKTLGEQLRGYLAEYGEPAEETTEPAAEAGAPAAPDGAADAPAESAAPASPAAAIAAVAAIGELLKRRKDALDGANVRIGDLDAEISAMTSQKSEMDTQAEQQQQALADLTAQLEAAQAELQTYTAEAETLKQQVADLTAQLEAAQANVTAATGEADALKQQVADVTAQLEAAQAEIAQSTTDADTLKNQLEAVQAQAAATEQERVRLDAQLRLLDDNLSRFGAALAADDETEVSALAQSLGAEEAPADETTRSIDVPLVKTAGAVALAGVAGKKLADLKAASTQLSALQQEHTALLAVKSDLENQLQNETAALEATKTQLADLQAELAAANTAHADEIQVLDAKTAELQSQYNEAESARLRLESSLAALNQEIEQLGAALDSDDDAGLQQFAQRLAPAETAGTVELAEPAAEQENGAAKVLGVAAVAAAVQRKQAAIKEAAFKEADERAATIQAQLDEVIAEKEAAKTLLADRDQALQEVETKLTEVTTQAEAKVSDFKAAARAAAEERGIEVQTVRALQDFAALKHIGVTFEQRLYRAGAGTFWEVAHMTDEDFAIILRLTEMQQLAMDLNETRADAVRLAEETGTLGAISEGETPDDFEPIQGIGKVFEQRLYSAGIRTYWDLANTSEEQLAQICKARKPLVPDYAAWIRQARILMEVRSDDSQ